MGKPLQDRGRGWVQGQGPVIDHSSLRKEEQILLMQVTHKQRIWEPLVLFLLFSWHLGKTSNIALMDA